MKRFISILIWLCSAILVSAQVTKVGTGGATKTGAGTGKVKTSSPYGMPFPTTNLANWWDSNTSLTQSGSNPNIWTDIVGGKTLTAVATAHPMTVVTAAGRKYIEFNNGGAASGGYFTMDASLTWNQQAVSWYYIFARRPTGSSNLASLYWGATGNDAGLFSGAEWEHWNGSGITSSGFFGGSNVAVYFIRVNGGTNVKIGASAQVATISSNPGAGTNTGGVVGEWNSPPAFPMDVGLLLGIVKYDEYTSDATHTAILAGAARYYKSTTETASKLWVTTGDSRTYGADSTDPWLFSYPAQVAQAYSTQPYYVNVGESGTLIRDNTAATLTLDQFAHFSGFSKVATNGYGVNDILNGRTSAQIIADLHTWISNVRAAYPGAVLLGNTIFTFTGITGGQDTIRAAVNADIVGTAAPTGFDYPVDLAGDARLQDPTNPVYFLQTGPGAGLHLTDVGNGVVASLEKTVLDAHGLLSSNVDFRPRTNKDKQLAKIRRFTFPLFAKKEEFPLAA